MQHARCSLEKRRAPRCSFEAQLLDLSLLRTELLTGHSRFPCRIGSLLQRLQLGEGRRLEAEPEPLIARPGVAPAKEVPLPEDCPPFRQRKGQVIQVGYRDLFAGSNVPNRSQLHPLRRPAVAVSSRSVAMKVHSVRLAGVVGHSGRREDALSQAAAARRLQRMCIEHNHQQQPLDLKIRHTALMQNSPVESQPNTRATVL
mmetsp:Transcript_443/g.959  ORF Transcript_443/g.959 Transcript_443/m.959 type:complete len:201 (-) Transcript_443:380-982(-)